MDNTATEILRYEGKTYRLVFVNSDSSMPISDRVELCINAVEMKHNRKSKRKVKGETFEGTIKHCGHYGIGIFWGDTYRAKVETNQGDKDITMLIVDNIDNDLN